MQQGAVGVREVGSGEGHGNEPEVGEDDVEEEDVARVPVQEKCSEEEDDCQDGL